VAMSTVGVAKSIRGVTTRSTRVES